jgi:hypothetical protein
MGKSQGIQSKNNVRVGQRLGPGAQAINHAGVAQIGQRQGNHFTNGGADGRMESRYGGVDIYSTGPGFNKAPLGNAKALDVGGGGCGTGRTIYPLGSQGTHGPVVRGNAPSKGDVLGHWKR